MNLKERVSDRIGRIIGYTLRSRASTDRLRCAEEVFYQQNYRWLAERLKPNTTILDIGASIGDTAIYFAQFREVKKIIAYEPMPLSFSLAQRNIKAAGFAAKVTLINAAVSSSDGRVRMPEGINDVSFNIREDCNDIGIPIKKIALKRAIKGLRNVAIKCDAEGEEGFMFDTDLSNVYAIMLEWHGSEALYRSSRALNYRGFTIELFGEIKDKRYGELGILCAWRPVHTAASATPQVVSR